MNKILLVIVTISVLATTGMSQNVDLVSRIDIDEPGSDVWGYVDKNDIEYGIFGTRNSTIIYSLEDPANPIQRAIIPGASSVWRDIKDFGEYIYVVADEGQDGLLIIDMTKAPDTITHKFYDVQVSLNDQIEIVERCHNIYADKNGYLYLAGCANGNKGVIILDANIDPLNPSTVSIADLVTAHDVFALDEKMYVSEIFNGRLGIYDISDITNPTFIIGQNTSSNFTHNAWTSDDGNYVFTTDERGNGYVDAYDISNLDDIKFLDKFQPYATQNQGVIPHNTHYHEGFLFTSWYTDGLIITDASRPENLVQVGAYDTWSGSSGGFEGCWGAYPFLPSGLVLASNISTTNGAGSFYILQPNLQRATYLEGKITSLSNGAQVNMATIEIKSAEKPIKNSEADGGYKMGQVQSGTFEVLVTHPAYKDKTVFATLTNGEVTILDIALESKEMINLELTAINAVNQQGLDGVQFAVFNDQSDYTISGDVNGKATLEVLEGSYQIIAGKWGYLYAIESNVELLSTNSIEFTLDEGIVDDFVFDYGWSTSATASSGLWELGIPNPTIVNGVKANVDADLPDDFGITCYMTGNGGGGAGFDDVDDGIVTLTSPKMDLTMYNNPVLKFTPWYLNAGGGGSASNDSLLITISNGIESLTVDVLKDENKTAGFWRDQMAIIVSDYLAVTDEIQISFTANDDNIAGHVVEAGLDQFSVVEGLPSATLEAEYNEDFIISPNPFDGFINIKLDQNILVELNNATITIRDVSGKKVLENRNINLTSGQMRLDIPNINTGIYILSIQNQEHILAQKKLVKTE